MKYKENWNLEVLKKPKSFKNLSEECENAAKKFIKKWSKNAKYLVDAKTLKVALDEYNTFLTDYGYYEAEWLYYYLSQHLDQNDPKIKANYNKVYKKYLELYNSMHFFPLSITKINSKLQKEFLKDKNLSEYKHWLERSFREGAHTLSEKEEKIMNLKGKVSHSNWTKMLSGLMTKEEREVLDEEGKKAIKNFSEIIDLISDKNKKVRDKAASVLNQIFSDHLDVAEHEFNSILEDKQVNDSIRGFSRPDESRFISDDIDSESVDLLVKTVTKRFDIAKEFYKLKAKALGQKKLEYHERNVEVGKITKKFELEEGYKIVGETFENLDEDFAAVFYDLFHNGRVDAFTKKGKTSGAFAMTISSTLPSFTLLNYTKSLNDLLTMAHEFGHIINFELSKKQIELNFDFPMCTAETASTFCEDFVLDRMLEEVTDEERFAIQMMKLNSDISTVFRQIAFYNFETEIHAEFRKQGYLSKEEIGRIFRKHMESYMGDYVEQNDGSENWWIYVSHFRSFFYVYSYAFGLLVSKSMQAKVKEDRSFMNNVKEFYSAGNSKSPKEILTDVGIDITKSKTWNKGIDEIEALLEDTKKLFNRIGK